MRETEGLASKRKRCMVGRLRATGGSVEEVRFWTRWWPMYRSGVPWTVTDNVASAYSEDWSPGLRAGTCRDDCVI